LVVVSVAVDAAAEGFEQLEDLGSEFGQEAAPDAGSSVLVVVPVQADSRQEAENPVEKQVSAVALKLIQN